MGIVLLGDQAYTNHDTFGYLFETVNWGITCSGDIVGLEA
jgi:hypothetical protein